MHGLAILIGKKPHGDVEEHDGEEHDEEGDEEEGGIEDEFLKQAHEAMKDDDSESFVRAMKGAIKACIQKYGEEDEDEEEGPKSEEY